MLQSELNQACREYRQEIEAEMRRLVRQTVAGQPFDVERYASLSNESLLFLVLEATAAGLGESSDGVKVEVHCAHKS